MRAISFGLMLIYAVVSQGLAQFRVSGQASAAFVKANDGYSQYAVNGGNGTFVWRLDVLGDVVVADNIFFLSSVRMLQDNVPHIDLFALRMTDIASTGLEFEAGEIEIPFGNLGERRFPKSNPFYDLPLTHTHRTSFRSSNYRLWVDDARYTMAGDGVQLLDQGLYDIGAKLSGSIGVFDYTFSVINGMISATSTYSLKYGSGLNNKSGFGKIARLEMTPLTGLTLGGSYAEGPFLNENVISGSYTAYSGASDYPQQIVEGDIDYSIGHFAMYGETFFNIWKLGAVVGSDLKALGYSIEGKFTPVPRLSFAARAAGIVFNEITTTIVQENYTVLPYQGKWDHDVLRFEGALGYRIDRDALVKLVYELNSTLGVGNDPVDNVLVVQTVFSF